jgi:hypothetical protein
MKFGRLIDGTSAIGNQTSTSTIITHVIITRQSKNLSRSKILLQKITPSQSSLPFAI